MFCMPQSMSTQKPGLSIFFMTHSLTEAMNFQSRVEMGGDELCASVKSDIETSHIPVMLLTALGDEKDMLEGLENGADAYITKPFSINVLRANIRNILANRALLKRAYAGLEDGVGQVPPDCHNTRDWKFMEQVWTRYSSFSSPSR
mgnify:CR=1 FL=1